MSLWIAPCMDTLPLLAAISEMDDWMSPYDPLVLQLRAPNSRPLQPRQWTRSVDLRGFEPKEVSVMHEERKLRVMARHDEGAENVTLVKRTVDLPDYVDVEKLTSGFTRDGFLLLRAPFKEQPDRPTQSIWDELRSALRGADLGADAASAGQIVPAPDGSKRFRAELSLREFKPGEIRVRQQGDCVLVEAEHKEETGEQRVHRRLERLYRLPDGAKLDQVASRLTNDGCLCIEAPFEAPPAKEQPIFKDVPMEIEQLLQPQPEPQLQEEQQHRHQPEHKQMPQDHLKMTENNQHAEEVQGHQR